MWLFMFREFVLNRFKQLRCETTHSPVGCQRHMHSVSLTLHYNSAVLVSTEFCRFLKAECLRWSVKKNDVPLRLHGQHSRIEHLILRPLEY